ncbi:glycoside hydrolase family 73 protein [Furfurilactobacillus entadae]|uniref:glycoside hydrolase family 73 protein n=1 Tax=Furfurilactobacillus entadae TaxID=2922307 RepID=UPI0035F0DCE6
MAKKKRRGTGLKRFRRQIKNFFIDHGRLRWFNTGLVMATVLVLALAISGVGVTMLTPQKATPQVDSVTQEHQAFIKRVAPYAQQLQQRTHVLASVQIAQAILESDWGSSTLASKYHNYFGVKAGSAEPGVTLSTQEYVNDHYETVNARFRTYANWQESFTAHAQLFVNGVDWNANKYADVLAATDYKAGAAALQKDGYATDPAYTNKIIEVVEKYHLNKYDQTN